MRVTLPSSKPFQSTPPMRRATGRSGSPLVMVPFQSTPPMRRATSGWRSVYHEPRVSIHAPHAEGDCEPLKPVAHDDVSIHAPHAEGDIGDSPPLTLFRVSIHAPHAEGDSGHAIDGPGEVVSIHAPHAEGDGWKPARRRPRERFNPRPPCGGRHSTSVGYSFEPVFQSTPPMRRATVADRTDGRGPDVSIHAPHAEGDQSAEGRDLGGQVSIHAPHAEGDGSAGRLAEGHHQVSIHAPHAEGD